MEARSLLKDWDRNASQFKLQEPEGAPFFLLFFKERSNPLKLAYKAVKITGAILNIVGKLRTQGKNGAFFYETA